MLDLWAIFNRSVSTCSLQGILHIHRIFPFAFITLLSLCWHTCTSLCSWSRYMNMERACRAMRSIIWVREVYQHFARQRQRNESFTYTSRNLLKSQQVKHVYCSIMKYNFMHSHSPPPTYVGRWGGFPCLQHHNFWQSSSVSVYGWYTAK